VLIVELLMNEIRKRLEERKIGVQLSQQAKEWLAKEGFDPMFGARPLRRALQRHVENPLSKRILAEEFREGDEILVDVGGKGLTFTKTKVSTKAAV